MTLYPPFLKRGITLTPSLILIPRWARHDSAYLAHEQCHAAQQRKHGVLRFWWLYLLSDDFRLIIEVEAFKVHIAAGASLDYCARQLSTSYWLDISFEKANELLKA